MSRKLLSLLLAAVLLFAALPVSAQAADRCDCGTDPVIFIDGLNGCDLIRDAGSDRARRAFPFDPADILTLLTDNRAAVWDMLNGEYSDENRQIIVDAICEKLLPDIGMTPDGESLYDITADWSPEPNDVHRDGGYFAYRYDWRLDPFVNAAGLADYIGYVKDKTGHDKVDLLAVSLGGTILTTYLSVYGAAGIDDCIWYCGAQSGVYLANTAFTGNVYIDAQEGTAFLHEATPDSFEYQLLSMLLQGMTDVCFTGSILHFTNKILANLASDGGYRELLQRTFGKMPGVWACVDDSAYEDAKDYIFPTEADRAENAGLIEKIDRYHYEVQANLEELMTSVRREGGAIAVVANYGYHLAPFAPDSNVMADRLLDTAHSSCGATFARYGEQLPAGRTVSPDRMADASTALFPEYTWLLRGLMHGERPAPVRALFRFIFDFDGQPAVNDDPAYPQYMQYDHAADTLAPQTGKVPKEGKLAARIRAFFLRIVWFFRSLFAS